MRGLLLFAVIRRIHRDAGAPLRAHGLATSACRPASGRAAGAKLCAASRLAIRPLRNFAAGLIPQRQRIFCPPYMACIAANTPGDHPQQLASWRRAKEAALRRQWLVVCLRPGWRRNGRCLYPSGTPSSQQAQKGITRCSFAHTVRRLSWYTCDYVITGGRILPAGWRPPDTFDTKNCD